MFSHFILFLLFLNVECYRYTTVKDFQLIDLYNSSLRDKFPVYFQCTFLVSNSNITILFQRQETKNFYLNRINHSESFYHNYESFRVTITNSNNSEDLTATAVLYPNKETYSNKNLNSEPTLEVLINIFNRNILFLELKPKRNSTGINKRNHFKTNDYMAIKYSANHSASINSKKSRRQAFNKEKLNLEIEACIIIKHSVYQKIKAYLNTNNHNFAAMYISIHMAHIMNVVNHIFRSIKTSLFSLEALLVKLSIQTEDNPIFNPDNIKCNWTGCYINKYIQKVNEYFWKYYTKENPADCDTILLIHDYKNKSGNVVGLAHSHKICDPAYFTSLILFSFESHMGQVIAHEIFHQLGSAFHDNEKSPLFTKITNSKQCPYYLLRTAVQEGPNGYLVSECTIDQVIDHLFTDNKLNMANAKCLVTTNNPKKHETLREYNQLAMQELPGYFYSISDQCRFVLQTPDTFIFTDQEYSCTIPIRCYRNDRDEAIRVLDGTLCGPNKICWMAECIIDQKKIKPGNSLLSSALLLRDTCPNGPDQSKIISRVSLRKIVLNCSDLIYTNVDCFYEFLNYDVKGYDKTIVFKVMNYTSICCETCRKSQLSQCDYLTYRGKNCKPTTCETLQSNPCHNGGKCVTNQTALEQNKNTNDSKVHFYCECKHGYYGDLCLRFSPCKMMPCKKGQICYEYGELGHYICLSGKDHNGHSLYNDTSNWFEDTEDKIIANQEKFWHHSAYLYRYYTNISIMSAFFLILITSLIWKRKYFFSDYF